MLVFHKLILSHILLKVYFFFFFFFFFFNSDLQKKPTTTASISFHFHPRIQTYSCQGEQLAHIIIDSPTKRILNA